MYLRSELIEALCTECLKSIPVGKTEPSGKLALGTSFPLLAVVPALWKVPVSCPDCCLAFGLALTDTEYSHWTPTRSLSLFSVLLVLRLPLTQNLLSLFLLENCLLSRAPPHFTVWLERFPLERSSLLMCFRLLGFLFQACKTCFMREIFVYLFFFSFLNFNLVYLLLFSSYIHQFMCFEQPQSHLQQKLNLTPVTRSLTVSANVQKLLLIVIQQ